MRGSGSGQYAERGGLVVGRTGAAGAYARLRERRGGGQSLGTGRRQRRRKLLCLDTPNPLDGETRILFVPEADREMP
jgi:hypothetical protein